MAPFRQRTIYEVNAELSFFQLNGEAPDAVVEALGEGHGGAASSPGGEDAGVLADHRRRGAGSAPRRTSSTRPRSSGRPGGSSPRPAVRIPADPEWDEQGLRMEIVR